MKFNSIIVVLFVLVAQLSVNAGCSSSRLSASSGSTVVQGNRNRVGMGDGRIAPAGIPLFFDVPLDVVDVEIFISTFEWFKKGVVISVFPADLVLLARAGNYKPLKAALSERLSAAEVTFERLVVNSPVSLKKSSRARAQVRLFFQGSIEKILKYLHDMADDQILEVMTAVEAQVDGWITHLKAVLDA